MWALEELADDCAEDQVYEFLLVAKPLNLIGGVGSPANALADVRSGTNDSVET